MPDTTPIVRGYALHPEQDVIVREYARRRCGGNTSLAVRTIISHFGKCPCAAEVEPLVASDPVPQPQGQAA